KPGILKAKTALGRREAEPQGPEASIARQRASKVEADDHPLGRQLIDGDPAVYVPHEERRVEILRAHLPVNPALAPLTEPVDDGPELFAGLRQAVLPPPPSRQRDALDDAALLEGLQALGEERARDQGHTAPQIVEAPASAEHLAKDQRRPPLGENLARHRDRAELAVAPHRKPDSRRRRTSPQVHFMGLALPFRPAIVHV